LLANKRKKYETKLNKKYKSNHYLLSKSVIKGKVSTNLERKEVNVIVYLANSGAERERER